MLLCSNITYFFTFFTITLTPPLFLRPWRHLWMTPNCFFNNNFDCNRIIISFVIFGRCLICRQSKSLAWPGIGQTKKQTNKQTIFFRNAHSRIKKKCPSQTIIIHTAYHGIVLCHELLERERNIFLRCYILQANNFDFYKLRFDLFLKVSQPYILLQQNDTD